jgi:hypothetical protein
MRGQFWCIFGFTGSSSQKVWVMRVYGLREVWIKRGLTVATFVHLVSEFSKTIYGYCVQLDRRTM